MRIIITESNLKKVQYKYLNNLFGDLYEVKSKEYPNSIFWKKDGKVILELKKPNIMWVSAEIWYSFSDMFPLDYLEIQQVMNEWLEQHLNLEGIILIVQNLKKILFSNWNDI